jgi:hypothetical protein
VLSRVGKREEALRMVEQALLLKPSIVDTHLGPIRITRRPGRR